MQTDIADTLGLIHAEQDAAGERVQPPADPGAIRALQVYAHDQLGVGLPHSYTAFLSDADGLDFNGTVLYATAQRELPGGGVLLGFRESNETFRKEGERHYVLYGETGNELFAQDQRGGAWCILDRGSLSVLERFSDSDALLERVLRRAYEG